MLDVHIPDEKRIKLDDISESCVLLGYSEPSKAYQMYYDPVNDKVTISRDVKFEEDRKWDWDVTHKKDQLVELDWADANENHVEQVVRGRQN